MSQLGWLALYSGGILVVSLVGGSVPFIRKVTHSRLQLYLSLSAGVMLGAAFFHVMPDAFKMAGAVLIAMVLGPKGSTSKPFAASSGMMLSNMTSCRGGN